MGHGLVVTFVTANGSAAARPGAAGHRLAIRCQTQHSKMSQVIEPATASTFAMTETICFRPCAVNRLQPTSIKAWQVSSSYRTVCHFLAHWNTAHTCTWSSQDCGVENNRLTVSVYPYR